MADLLVKLYTLPESAQLIKKLREEGIVIKRAIGPEKQAVAGWVERTFSRAWASECEVAMSAQPAGCFLAVKGGEITGFACYDATSKGFFGPIGVEKSARGCGAGKALLIRTLEAMREAGYGYGVIGWAGPVEFFEHTVGAALIEGSEPGVYRDMVKAPPRK